jgi:hypothetical protein
MNRVVLSHAERALLRLVRDADEDRGGLSSDELTTDEYAPMDRLCALGLVEVVGEFGEAPDGEEDERDAGQARGLYRITGAGVRQIAADADL